MNNNFSGAKQGLIIGVYYLGNFVNIIQITIWHLKLSGNF